MLAAVKHVISWLPSDRILEAWPKDDLLVALSLCCCFLSVREKLLGEQARTQGRRFQVSHAYGARSSRVGGLWKAYASSHRLGPKATIGGF